MKMFAVTATVEHSGNETYTDHRNRVREDEMDRVRAEMRREVPAGGSIDIQVREWTPEEMR